MPSDTHCKGVSYINLSSAKEIEGYQCQGATLTIPLALTHEGKSPSLLWSKFHRAGL